VRVAAEDFSGTRCPGWIAGGGCGIPITKKPTEPSRTGFGDGGPHRGKGASSSSAGYLTPVRGRPKPHVVTVRQATRVKVPSLLSWGGSVPAGGSNIAPIGQMAWARAGHEVSCGRRVNSHRSADAGGSATRHPARARIAVKSIQVGGRNRGNLAGAWLSHVGPISLYQTIGRCRRAGTGPLCVDQDGAAASAGMAAAPSSSRGATGRARHQVHFAGAL